MTPSTSLPWRLALLAVVAAAAAVALLVHGPIVQWPDYHAFADAAPWLGIPNAANVLSNAPFAVIGWVAWRALGRSAAGSAWLAWRSIALAIFATAFGSAWYHWNPNDAALVLDRLPIAWACAAIACALLAERVDARWSSSSAVAAAIAVATASVAVWALSGDLRAYVFVQFVPLLLVIAVLATRLAPVERAGSVGDGAWCAAIVLYAIAKACEAADQGIHEILAPLSGHVLKHLFAAAGAAVLLAGAVRSRQAAGAAAASRSTA
jgi:hypothetical protein